MTLPSIPDAFRWTHESWGAALRCRPLETIAPHLFTTRQLELSSPAHRSDLADAVSARDVVLPVQVHGRGVVVLRQDALPLGEPSEGDVVVSNASDVAIAVKAADCVPLLIADKTTGAVAAVHAGWRGTAARASIAALDTLRMEFTSKPTDLVVAIGPCIGPCCYEVGSELVDAFAVAGHQRYLVDRWFLAPPPPRGTRQRPKMRLDVAGANRDQLILAGVPEEQIYMAGLCTAMNLDVFTSYRAEREKAGRIAGVIRARA